MDRCDWRRRFRLFGCLLILCLCGCSRETVQEDRSINYSTEGGAVAFQHGEEGVFIATSEGQSLQQIHDASDALAVSAPLWSPVDDRLIFTTAHPADSAELEAVQPLAAWDANPEGREFLPQQIVYTCWLREASHHDEQAKPSAIFTARCDHPGYVAANLAVRWHPGGDRILFVDQDEEGGVSLFEFDLLTDTKRRLLEHRASAMLFDWSPGHRYLTCALYGVQGNSAHDGIWIRSEASQQWWQVPQSGLSAPAQNFSRLELLRETRPAWTADEQQFAFIDLHVYADGRQVRRILRATPASQAVSQLYETEAVLRDLRWHPDSQRLAFVDAARQSLQSIDDAGSVSAPMNQFDVRYFVGWSHDGSKLAYVSPEPVVATQSEWMFLFPAVAGARDRVYVADGNGCGDAQLVHDGIRVTFPQWSPDQDELSLWGTYAPTHVSWLSVILPWSLRRGDPAAVLDAQTGELQWMAVNAHEQSQVGHYYLLKRDYEKAWYWYEKAAEDRPPVEPIKLADCAQLMQQRRIFQNPLFFEFYCLSKLGRAAEAEQRLNEFCRSMTLQWTEEDLRALPANLSGPVAAAELRRLMDVLTPVLRAVYMTEVFLSLDAAEDGAEFFAQRLAGERTDAERLADLICLSQLLLSSKSYDEYADVVTQQLAPLLERMLVTDLFPFREASNVQVDWTRWTQQAIVVGGGGIAALPMASSEFVSQLSESHARQLLADWDAFHQTASSDEVRWAADLVRHELLVRLRDDRQHELATQIAGTSLALAGSENGMHVEIDELIQQIREFSAFIAGTR